MKIKFTVEREPFGKQRPRFSRRGRFTTTYTPQKTVDYEQVVREACGKEMYIRGFDGWQDGSTPLYCIINAYYKIPQSISKAKLQQIFNGELLATKKPDWDNIGKIICDSLNGIAYKDDAQIISGSVYKHYSTSPRVEVEIGEIKERGEEHGI